MQNFTNLQPQSRHTRKLDRALLQESALQSPGAPHERSSLARGLFKPLRKRNSDLAVAPSQRQCRIHSLATAKPAHIPETEHCSRTLQGVGRPHQWSLTSCQWSPQRAQAQFRTCSHCGASQPSGCKAGTPTEKWQSIGSGKHANLTSAPLLPRGLSSRCTIGTQTLQWRAAGNRAARRGQSSSAVLSCQGCGALPTQRSISQRCCRKASTHRSLVWNHSTHMSDHNAAWSCQNQSIPSRG